MHIFCNKKNISYLYTCFVLFFAIRNGNKFVLFLSKENNYCKLNINLLESKEYELPVNSLIKDVSKMERSYIDKREVLKISYYFSRSNAKGYAKRFFSDIKNE